MSQSLRERVQERINAELASTVIWANKTRCAEVSDTLTTAVFEVMSNARPCVDCGKGIGPDKVKRGYVQCYACSRGASTTT